MRLNEFLDFAVSGDKSKRKKILIRLVDNSANHIEKFDAWDAYECLSRLKVNMHFIFKPKRSIKVWLVESFQIEFEESMSDESRAQHSKIDVRVLL